MEVELRITELERKVDLLKTRIEIVNGQRLDMKDAYYDLKHAFETFVDQVSTQISTALIMPLIRTTIQANVNLPEAPDLLNVEFLYQAGRRIMEEMNRKLKGPEPEKPKEEDSLLKSARKLAQKHKKMSVSFLQRKLHVGYPQAAGLVEQLKVEKPKRKRTSTYIRKRVLELPEDSALVKRHHEDEIPLFETIDRIKAGSGDAK